MTSTVASAIRPGLRDHRPPSSPHTPSRFISSNFSSPGSTFRQEEDAVIIELGSRHLCAGFEGESGPQCVMSFGPEHSTRVGDYRRWAPGYDASPERSEDWGNHYELWRHDLKDVDLGLVEDKIERAIREIYNKYLLTDAGSARLVLVLSSVIPQPLLSSLLSTLFERWSYSTITILPSPTMAAIGGGLRSALVVDIGWEEAVVTPVYEYREFSSTRSTRSMKMLTKQIEELLIETRLRVQNVEKDALPVDFCFAEEVVNRMAFCDITKLRPSDDDEFPGQVEAISVSDDDQTHDLPNQPVDFHFEWPTHTSSCPIKVPRLAISQCVERVFMDGGTIGQHLDDQEQLLPQIVYDSLLHLRPDVRATCMSRVVFSGGGSNIPGLRQRMLRAVQLLIRKHGWEAVRGRKFDMHKRTHRGIAVGEKSPPAARHNTPSTPLEGDNAGSSVQKEQIREAQPHLQGVLRVVDSLGPWAGASLLASLKVKGFVEIERDRFLSHGMGGAHRDVEISVVPQRMSSFGLAAAKQNERPSWTLAGWG